MCFGKTFHHILMHFISYIQCFEDFFKKPGYFFKNSSFSFFFFQNFDWSNLSFDQSKLHLKFHVSFCLFRSIETNFWSIETCKLSFKKIIFNLFKQTFSKLFSLSPTRQGSTKIFCRFPPNLLQGFSLPKPVFLYYPSFCIDFHIFMHYLTVFG